MLLLLPLLALPLALASKLGSPALQEEFNVLVYGTLQLGQALGSTYSSTSNKLQKIEGRQSQQEKTLKRLRMEVSSARQDSRWPWKEAKRLQREEHERRTVYQRIEGDLQETQRGYEEIQRRVHNLEKGMQERSISDLKAQVEQHHLILQVLAEESSRQKKQMTKQTEQLINIIKRTSAIGSR